MHLTSRICRAAAVAAVALSTLFVNAHAADKDQDPAREKKPRKSKADKKADKDPASIFDPNEVTEAKDANDRRIVKQLEHELAARSIPMQPGVALETEWDSPFLSDATSGKVVHAWVRDDFILVETAKKLLIAIRRADGAEQWRSELSMPIRYAPSISRNNVVVNLNNTLVAFAKDSGEIRWKLDPEAIMSSEPVVVDPPVYPKELTRKWQGMESLYAAGWDGRFYSMLVRERVTSFFRDSKGEEFIGPDFELFPNWAKNLRGRGVAAYTPKVRDNVLYFAADDRQCYAVNRDGEVQDPYLMLDKPSSNWALTGNNFYVGSMDNNIYCLDRLTMKKKWSYAAGSEAVGDILAEDTADQMVFFTTKTGLVNCLRVNSGKFGHKGEPETLESATKLWSIEGGGVITTGKNVVYVSDSMDVKSGLYKGVKAVDRETGKVRWHMDSGFFSLIMQVYNESSPRLYAVTVDNRIISLREPGAPLDEIILTLCFR